MKLNEYQEMSRRTLPEGTMKDRLTNYSLGLTGESGEVADEIKKVLFHGHDFHTDKIEKELGDVLHYVAGLASFLGLTLEDIATKNIEKLRQRYPNGFSEEDSINRTV